MNTILAKSLSISEVLKIYQYAHKKIPLYHIDIREKLPLNIDVIVLEKDENVKAGLPIRLGFYALLLCTSGESKRYVNQHEFHIKKSSFQLIPPNSMFSFQNITDKTTVKLLFFTENFIAPEDCQDSEIRSLIGFHKTNIHQTLLSNNDFLKVTHLYNEINLELHKKNNDSKLVIKLLILTLLHLLRREKITIIKPPENQTIHENRSHYILNHYLSLIETNYLEYRQVFQYAKIIGITPKHLSETIKETTGHNALHFIHHRLLREAFYLLEFSNLNIAQIAHLLKFSNASDFSRFFKIKSGQNPNTYRLHVQKKSIPTD